MLHACAANPQDFANRTLSRCEFWQPRNREALRTRQTSSDLAQPTTLSLSRTIGLDRQLALPARQGQAPAVFTTSAQQDEGRDIQVPEC